MASTGKGLEQLQRIQDINHYSEASSKTCRQAVNDGSILGVSLLETWDGCLVVT
jgi:hypothetical protein